MTARIIRTEDGPAVEASLAAWRAVGRFLHVGGADEARTYRLVGLAEDEAETLAARIDTMAAQPQADDTANRVRRDITGRNPFSLLSEAH